MTPNALTFARKRDAEGCLEAHELLCLRPFVVRISKQIGYVYDVTFGYCPPEQPSFGPAS